VTFAEVSFDDGDEGNTEPVVTVSGTVDLSPLREEYCVSTHPRERPELKPGMESQRQLGELVLQANCRGTTRRLRGHFPGLASLVNFFKVAASHRAASKSAGLLPQELYDRILDFVDYDTWRACLAASREFRSTCLRKYRLDNRMRIVAGPFVKLNKHHKTRLLSFDFEDMRTGKTLPVIQAREQSLCTEECNWMLVLSSDRKVVMLDLVVEFEPAEDVTLEADSDDESAKS